MSIRKVHKPLIQNTIRKALNVDKLISRFDRLIFLRFTGNYLKHGQNQLFVALLLLPPSPNEPNKLLTIVFPAVLIMLFTMVLLATFSKVLSSGLTDFLRYRWLVVEFGCSFLQFCSKYFVSAVAINHLVIFCRQF